MGGMNYQKRVLQDIAIPTLAILLHQILRTVEFTAPGGAMLRSGCIPALSMAKKHTHGGAPK